MNIVLIGMPGCGKSTLGVLLAKTLGMDFTDTDLIIQKREGRRLQEIIDNDGIDAFLRTESEVISSLRVDNTVIATGGSAVYSDPAMRAISRGAVVVFIAVPFEELEKRLTNIKTRGVAIRPGRTLRSVFDEREPLYEKYAGITVDCSGCRAEESVELIVDALAGIV